MNFQSIKLGEKIAMQCEINENPWLYFQRFYGRRLPFLEIGANMVGVGIVTFYFLYFDRLLPFGDMRITMVVIGIMSVGLVLLAMIILSNWKKDLELFVTLKARNQSIDNNLHKSAQRKILDMPFISSMMSLFNWFLAAVIMSIYLYIIKEPNTSHSIVFFYTFRIFIGLITAGLVVSAIVFSSVEIFSRRLRPYFFPDGGVVTNPCTFRLNLSVRMLIFFVLTSILPIILMAALSYNKAKLMLIMNPDDVVDSLLYLTAFLLATTLAMAIILSRLFSTSIIRPIRQMEAAMSEVEQGNLTVSIPVENNDELGALAEHFNQMTDGLIERERMQQSLNLAKGVQQNLLPKRNLKVNGFDIAGKSIYCDETGGDYYDFITIEDADNQKIGVAIGDVSGHGIPSALLMATVRSSLRQRVSLPGSIAKIISDVNRQLVRDVEDSGQFMTMFFLALDTETGHLQWVRAGHDPAILYDPQSDSFDELGGSGIALGVDDEWIYRANEKTDFSNGQIIFSSTDGIWEARNKKGEMLGKEPILDAIRQNASSEAEQIVDAIFYTLNEFIDDVKIEDDITSVVIKMQN